MNDLDKIYKELGEGICLFPFIGSFYKTFGNQEAGDNKSIPNSILPCSLARWDGENESNPWEIEPGTTIADARNSDHYKHTRQKFLAGEWKDLTGCVTCQVSEELSGSSPRMANNQFFAENIEEDIVELVKEIQANGYTSNKLKAMDYFPSNYCNYECAMCQGGASSKRLTFETKYHNVDQRIVFNEADEDFYELLSSLEILGFTGGETILQKQVHQLIDYLIEKDLAKNISITLLTNASNYPEQLIEKFKQFKKVMYTVSIDGTGDVIEYQRRGANWNNVQEVARKIYNTPHIHEFINYVVTSMNILNAMDWIDWMHDNDFKWFSISPVTRADQLSLLSLPDDLRKIALDRLHQGRKKYEHYVEGVDEFNYVRAIDQLIDIINQSNFDPDQLEQFVNYIKIENRVSKKPLHEVVPEWRPYFESYL